MEIAVDAVGICGTDVGIYRGKIPVSYPRVLGHEVVGRTLAAVEDGPPMGTRVIVDPNVSCGRCARCLEGRQNLCPFGGLLGRDLDGALGPVLSAPVTNLHLLPETVADHLAPLIQVLTTCVHGHRLVEIFPGDAVVVLGLGVTGLLHLQLAKMRGADPVIGVTRDESRLRLARELGASVTIPAGEAAVVAEVREATGGGAD
ncbi:MAG TPA: alcohol dehydrogenase catalytic domain-containing protein, partial [Actinomycetota bacterium]|nr:alcohol dehydrogenase catalytic domain-containing protein [Actinomycetota bacterium]